uniref:Uncharacterized protein n=1 Tax=Vespula pensylvanica TaxID=30213 RepID=A0A834PGF3_VESPE|nr:hypothetical protein H0235_001688 [Vespula pensylvanica]
MGTGRANFPINFAVNFPNNVIFSDADAIETHAECFNRRSVSLKYALYNAIEGKEWNDCESEFSLRRTRVGGEEGGGGGGERRRRKRRRKRRREGCWRWLALVLLVFHWDLEIKYLHESSFASVYTAKLASPKYSAFTRLVECQEGRRARRMRRRRRNIEIEVEVKVEEKVGWRGGGEEEEEYTWVVRDNLLGFCVY